MQVVTCQTLSHEINNSHWISNSIAPLGHLINRFAFILERLVDSIIPPGDNERIPKPAGQGGFRAFI